MPALALVVAALLVVTIVDAARRPSFRRLAVRNIVRRPNEAMLVVVGSLFGTAIITSAFVVGNTFDTSIRQLARTQQGPIDEVVSVDEPGLLPQVLGEITARPVPGTDGVTSAVLARASVATPADGPGERRAEPEAYLLEIDFDEARAFGSDPAATGFVGAGPTPRPGQAVVGEDLRDELEIEVGDRVQAFAYGSVLDLEVTGVVPRLGVAGWPGEASRSPNVFVAPGTLAELAAQPTAGFAQPPTGVVLVSNEGGVFDGVARTDQVVPVLEQRVAGTGADVQDAKRETLDNAARQGESFSQLFGGIGSFSVIAGILLLVNIFVMLAEERKTELGMLRAVGLKRNHLVRSFAMEGAIYACVAAVLGAVAGIGVGRVVVAVAANLLQQDDAVLQLTFGFRVRSVVTGLLIGLAISLVTVWATSLRIGRLNVIRAIRDVPEPPRAHHPLRVLVLGAVGVVVGGALLVSGLTGRAAASALLGPPIALFSAVPLLSRIVPRRLAVSVPAAVAGTWATTAFVVFPEVFEGGDIPLFVLQGVTLVGSAVTLLTVNVDQLGRLTDRLSTAGQGLAARLGLAYPLAKRFRTGLLLGMYALVIFTLTFMATLMEIFVAQAPRLTEDARAGYDVLVDSNPANPLTVERLMEQPEVVAVAPLVRAFPEFDAPFRSEPLRWPLSGFDERLLERDIPALSSRGSSYASDREAWEAVLASEDLAIIPGFFLQDDGGPPEGRVRIGEEVRLIDTDTGDEHVLTVAGIVEGDWHFNGALVAADLVTRFLEGDAVANRAYVAVAEGIEPAEAAEDLTGRLVAHGADAESFEDIVDRGLAQQEGFFQLLQGFLGLGLLIGIAGLGVVMVRAARERRREIGMLRAMGVSSGVVRRAFLLESTFIALQGIVVGIVLGLVTSWTVVTRAEVFGDEQLAFQVPWGPLVLVLVVPLAASLLAVLAPAAQAARIRPAAALRIAD